MSELSFNPFPVLETPRFFLRKISENDASDIFAFRSDEQVMRYIPRPVAKKPEDILIVVEMINTGIANNQSINWGICDKNTNKLIGIIGYVRMNFTNQRAEVGYVLHRDYHRRGIMNEALKAVIDYGFKGMNLNCIEAIIHPRNEGSIALIEKNNFKREGLLRDFNYHNEVFSDAYVYSLLKREYDQNTL